MGKLEGDETHATVELSTDELGSPVVSIAGEVDISNVSTVEAELEPALEPAPELLVVDLSALEFIDSSGIALVLRAASRVGRLELRKPSATVMRIIRATGLTDVLHTQP